MGASAVSWVPLLSVAMFAVWSLLQSCRGIRPSSNVSADFITVLIACLSPVAGVNLPVFEHYTDGSDSKFLILHAVAFAAAVSTSHCKTVLTVIKEIAKKMSL